VVLGVRPGDLRIAGEGIPARVDFVEDLGDSIVVNLESAGRRLKLKTDGATALAEGQAVRLAFAPAHAHLFDRQTGARL
jgi:multiple sugar transport system ATP-binding protein